MHRTYYDRHNKIGRGFVQQMRCTDIFWWFFHEMWTIWYLWYFNWMEAHFDVAFIIKRSAVLIIGEWISMNNAIIICDAL